MTKGSKMLLFGMTYKLLLKKNPQLRLVEDLIHWRIYLYYFLLIRAAPKMIS